MTIIPQPVSLTRSEGAFTLTPDTVIVSAREDVAESLAQMLRPATGYALPVKGQAQEGEPIIVLERLEDSKLGSEGYRLKVDSSSIKLSAPTDAGLFYADQSLRQLLPKEIFSNEVVRGVNWDVPTVSIEDMPRFAWRGAMLDVARHFMPLTFLKRFIDLLALHKLNRFHWHLTEDQGWRIEIKKYPRLTEVGAWRQQTLVGHARETPQRFDNTRHGGFYTQDEVRELVAYAAARHITVVPEIEMPGHATAAIAAYPEFGNTGNKIDVAQGWGIFEDVYNVEERTFSFLTDVLSEVLELFPSPFIHIGGDEVPKKQWRESPAAQARMRELGLKDEEELQSYFIRRIDAFLVERGRRLIGWDEILEGGLAPGATVMSWRGEKGGIAAAKMGHDVVMAPNTYTYLDYCQSDDPSSEPLCIGGFLPLEKVYSYEPIPESLTPEEAGRVLGAQAQLWTEYMPGPDRVEYMAFPRLSALSEVVWSPGGRKDYQGFLERLRLHLGRLDALGVNYRPLERA